ncbi:lysophospholipase [Faunimonas pinastri]|uniref:Lysophospholipase n=1 Tax=Faunimonas pinastri TaxID=1855383 RepID=A0A1H9P6S3_9HYPH|nr:alpha/beta hydrolase [Faunimonas pinastri]SER43283.1 lysophospholipase [Faunimonas pinastri]
MAELVDIPENPVPAGAVAITVTTPDGIALRAARWAAPPGRPRGTVLIVNGRTEFIERYFETVGDLKRRGYAVAAFDWRGQGGSQRLLADPRKGYVRSFSDYVTDLQTVMSNVVLSDCPPPYYLLAHSTGGAVALLYAERARTQIERMVLNAPLVGLPHRVMLMRPLLATLSALQLGKLSVPGRKDPITDAFERNVVTSDPGRYHRRSFVLEANPALGIGLPTIGWTAAAFRAMRRLNDPGFAESLRLPTLFVLPGDDRVVDPFAVERLAGRLKSAALVRVSGARHELLMERDCYREQFWAAFDAFML